MSDAPTTNRIDPTPGMVATAPGSLRTIKRTGEVVPYNDDKIAVAMTKAFIETEGAPAAASARIKELVRALTRQVSGTFNRRFPTGGAIHIEDIQDQVELALMRSGEQRTARAYVIYREGRQRERAERAAQGLGNGVNAELSMTLPDGTRAPLDLAGATQLAADACAGLDGADAQAILDATLPNLHDGITVDGINEALMMTARTLVETDPDYTYATARILLAKARREALAHLGVSDRGATQSEMAELYPDALRALIDLGIRVERISPKLAAFDLDRLGAALDASRDLNFTYLGLQTLYDRYFLHDDGTRYELPQTFLMRVAMGLAVEEDDPNARAIEFYDQISRFDSMCSTPTLFNSGTVIPQLSSCFLTHVPDDLNGIFGAIHDNAMLSKWSGGIGNDWTAVRALDAHIKGTNGKSQGVVPFLKVANDTAIAVNQGGKRRGAVCAYIETWHMDIEEFLDLRKNTGDDRRRTPDMNTANWIPDLFMERVSADGEWTLFSPDQVPDLHDLHGRAFKARYEHYEALARQGKVRGRTLRANELWRKMLSMLFETGHPWMTFKDACNVRSPQQHAGTIHSSNLCTEITLNTSEDEIAVCNLASVNLARHVADGALDHGKLRRTVRTAVRMLDNVIDINHYSVDAAKRSNLRHRPIGLGLMGFQDALHELRLPYASEAAVEFADRSMEAISLYAIEASADLARERGAYGSFDGSLWSQGILPLDSLAKLRDERGSDLLDIDESASLDWTAVRAKAKAGMRNSNVMAIAPTATIANITGASQSIEPTYQNLHVKSNMSGEFTVVNPYLVRDLKALGLWDAVMVSDLKYYDGSLKPIDRVPEEIKALHATAFEVEPRWLVDAAARRQKWIDQAQSLNVYMAEASGRKLDLTYRMAWLRGLKTTYYLRTLSATSTEKSTAAHGDLNAVQATAAPAAPQACAIDDPDCEACQ